MKKVLVALSGGIDSAATALILKDKGYEVAGVTFDITGDGTGIVSAGNLAERLGIKLLVEDIKDPFEKTIIKYFTESYMRAETPGPCSVCNPLIKWEMLKNIADREGFPLFATGHYVRIREFNGKYYVHRGADPAKDQSYYLWGLGQEILGRAITPLGNLTKNEVRHKMSEAGFSDLAAKPESMGVCFLRGKSYVSFLNERIPDIDKLRNGEVVDIEGNVIGTHNGYPFYTVGQKRGFETHGGHDVYILAIDPENNRLITGGIENLYVNHLTIRDYKATDIDELLHSKNVSVMVRGFGWNPEGFCKITLDGDRLSVITDNPAYAPAKGQPVAFYIGERLVGGGIIL